MRQVLDNGLTVILQENHAVRVAAMQLWVKVGSADEEADEAGLAHLHEHMLFKGTLRRGPGEIARAVENCGGSINAWTSFDQTVYHIVLASQFFGEGVDILADAVTESLFDPGELSREIEVVCEEIRRAEDMPSRRISRSLFDLSYAAHPYRRPVIGSEESVRSFTREKILNFYQRHYATPNMVFVAVGDFDEREALQSIERAFKGARTRAGTRTLTRLPEPPQQGARARIIEADIKETYLNAGWHIPSIRAEDVAALDLLAVLLGQGDASRLTLEVKRERGLVNEIYASAYTPQDPGLLVVGSTLKLENVEPALKEFLRQTYRLRREEFPAEDLARAKRMIESDTIFQRETVQGQARKLGFFETVAGHIEEEERYLKSIAKASGEDLRAAAERYLRTDNVSLALMRPNGSKGLNEADLIKIAQAAESELTPAVRTRPAAPYNRLTAHVGEAAPRDPNGLTIETLPNGVRLIVKQDRTVPIVTFRAAWPGGLRWESATNNGINNLLARMLLRGTEKRSAKDLARAIEQLAGSVGGTAGRNSYGARGEFLSADLDAGFALFSEVLLQPSFQPAEFERERAIVMEDIRARDDSPSGVAFALFNQALYDVHPYRMEFSGSAEAVGAITPDTLRQYRVTHYPVKGMTLSIVGDVDPVKARDLAMGLVGPRASEAFRPEVRQDQPLSGPRELQKRLDRKQAHLVIGFRGTTLGSEDRGPLDVLASVLSGQGGRLFLELRDKRSMAYSVSAFSSEGIDPGSVGVYIGTSPDKVADARAALIEQLKLIRSDFVSAEELDRARRHLVGGHEIGLQRLSARAGVMALDEAYGLGAERHLHYAERIRAVTADDVHRVARQYLDLDRVVTALVSPDA